MTSGTAARDQDPGTGAAPRSADTLVFVSSDGPVAELTVHHRNVIRAGRDSGVARSVALSGLDADPSSPFCHAVSYGHTGQPLAEGGCPVSIARASIYSEFFPGLLARSRTSGQNRLPAADGRISLVSSADVARCLAPLGRARLAPPGYRRPGREPGLGQRGDAHHTGPPRIMGPVVVLGRAAQRHRVVSPPGRHGRGFALRDIGPAWAAHLAHGVPGVFATTTASCAQDCTQTCHTSVTWYGISPLRPWFGHHRRPARRGRAHHPSASMRPAL
jgi:hypothetical protein